MNRVNVLVALREARAALEFNRMDMTTVPGRPEADTGAGGVAPTGEGSTGGGPVRERRDEVQAAAAVGLAELLDQLVEIGRHLGTRAPTWPSGAAVPQPYVDLDEHLRAAAEAARRLLTPEG